MKRHVLKRHVLLMLGGLALAFGLVVGNALGSLSADIEILNDPRLSAPDRIDLGLSFGSALCVSRQGGKTILEALIPEARRILIHRFDSGDWRDFEFVKGYIRRLLGAEPEGGMLSAGVYWAEMRPTEIFASVEFSNRQRRPLQLANGYAHFQDAAAVSGGLDTWARIEASGSCDLETLPNQWNLGACGGGDAWSRRGPSPLPCEGNESLSKRG